MRCLRNEKFEFFCCYKRAEYHWSSPPDLELEHVWDGVGWCPLSLGNEASLIILTLMEGEGLTNPLEVPTYRVKSCAVKLFRSIFE